MKLPTVLLRAPTGARISTGRGGLEGANGTTRLLAERGTQDTFSVTLYEDCPTFLVAASGYDED